MKETMQVMLFSVIMGGLFLGALLMSNYIHYGTFLF